MRLSLKHAFGPFRHFNALDLPDFAVLTGLNGSGKTQLLRAIGSGGIVALEDGVEFDSRGILYVGPELNPGLTLTYGIQKAASTERQLIKVLTQCKTSRSMIEAASRETPPSPVPAQVRKQHKDACSALQDVAETLQADPWDLLEQEVSAYAVALSAETDVGHFGTDIARVSMGHLRTHHFQMQAKYFAEGLDDRSLARLLSPDLVIGNKRPPWELITSVLQPFGFRLDGPEVNLKSAQSDLRLVLRNQRNEDVSPESLSGGERTLLALALAQYATRAGGSFPRLLLLDESLSTLHPKIVRQALDTIQEVFVKQNKTRVILVTHSPTVVALSPDAALFKVTNAQPTLAVESIERDVGLGLLTEGVPSLRIRIENQRQVLVESQQDQFVYSRLYQAIASRLDPTISLQFVGCGRRKGEGGKARVKQLVSDFRSAGASTVHGIVDWDREDCDVDGIHVLAAQERYSIENVMLDPLILAFVLASSAEGRAQIGVTTLVELTRATKEELQRIGDIVVKKIGAVATPQIDVTSVNVRYAGGFELQFPRWVLEEQGHQYAEWVLKAFPWLQRHRKGPNNEPADKMIAGIADDCLVDIVDWLPASLVNTFHRIQQAT